MKAPLPGNEAQRLLALRRYGILDTAPEAVFDDLVRLASAVCGAPIALLSLLDAERVWFKARVGLAEVEVVREGSFCSHAILEPGLTVVPDALSDPRVADGSLVAAGPRVRFYAGAPLVTPDGLAVGMLCVLDRSSRGLTSEQGESLRSLARLAVAELERRRHATLDGLTGLANRTLLRDRLSQALARAHRTRKPMAVILLDLDRFKLINDTLGHATGDAVLQEVAARLTDRMREADTVARMDGDEFMLILADLVHPRDAAAAAQKILECVSAPFQLDGRELEVTPSMGITLYPMDSMDAEGLIANADSALSRAKEEGRNGFRFFTADMNAHVTERLELVNGLRHALERREFLLLYQPQVDLASGHIVGVEALVRWNHPKLGLVPPNKFIPLAEESGLITSLGEWVLREACTRARAWRAGGVKALRMAVNLSARQFRHQDLVAMVEGVLGETGLEPAALELELTESCVMEDAEAAAVVIQSLHRLGVGIAIDDFGTGYSSLSQLKRFSLSALKIDQSFIRDLTGDPDDAAIVSAIIAMAHSLRLKIVAEGVETAEQMAFLREHRCDLVQGYYISRPVPAGELKF